MALVCSSVFPVEANSSAIPMTFGSRFELSLQLSTQVRFLSSASISSSSIVVRDVFPFRPGCWLLPLVLRLNFDLPPTGEECQPIFVGHPLNDQLEFCPVMALFKTDKIFFALDIDLRRVRVKVKEMWTLSFLFLKDMASSTSEIFSEIIPFRIQVVVTVSIVHKSGLPPSSHPIIPLSKFQTLSGVLTNTVRIDLKKQDLGVFILQNNQTKLPKITPSFSSPLLRHVDAENQPAGLRMDSQGRVEGPPWLWLPDTRW